MAETAREPRSESKCDDLLSFLATVGYIFRNFKPGFLGGTLLSSRSGRTPVAAYSVT